MRWLFSDPEDEESVVPQRNDPFKQSWAEINEFSSYLNEIKQISENLEGKIENSIGYKVKFTRWLYSKRIYEELNKWKDLIVWTYWTTRQAIWMKVNSILLQDKPLITVSLYWDLHSSQVFSKGSIVPIKDKIKEI